MTEPCVIDSSIGTSWVYIHQATPEAKQLLADFEAGAIMIVPLLWFAEMANVLLVLQRRRKITANERRDSLLILERLELIVDEGSVRAAFHEISDLAEKHDLTIYDATYLELALRRKTALATRDNPLRIAAQRCGIQVF